MLRLRSVPLFAALALLVLTGCRTYGDGYDIKPKTYRALQSAVESFEDELSRAEADLQMLRGAADDADTLRVLADRYEELIGEHNSLLDLLHQHNTGRPRPNGLRRQAEGLHDGPWGYWGGWSS